MAEDVAQPTPVAAAVNELFEHAKTTGLGDQDFSAVIEALRSDSKSWNDEYGGHGSGLDSVPRPPVLQILL